MYTVKEVFYTLQGEGANTGRPAVFCRFAACNLWSGHEKDRSTAVCQFCDTDFVGTDGPGGGQFASAPELADKVASAWPADASLSLKASPYRARASRLKASPYRAGASRARRMVVCTGGEPLLQLDQPLVDEFHRRGFEIAIETNGTLLPPPGIDWICVSPKAGAQLVVESGQELKLVFPQPGAEPEKFEALDFQWFFLQPMDGPVREANTRLALDYCLQHPQWRLSLQTHKFLGIP